MSTMAFSSPLTAGSPVIPPTNRQLSKNPLLPPLPRTGDMDSDYLAEEAILRGNIARQYADILQQLGWQDEAGNYIPGQVSIQAGRQLNDLGRASELAAEGVTEESQRRGTLFSGRRALETARAQFPYEQQIARLHSDVPVQLGGLYEQAAGLTDQYTLQNNLLLAAMARRRAAAAASTPAGTPAEQEASAAEAAADAAVGRPLTPADLGALGGAMVGGGPLRGTPFLPSQQAPASTQQLPKPKPEPAAKKPYYQSFKGRYGYKPQY